MISTYRSRFNAYAIFSYRGGYPQSATIITPTGCVIHANEPQSAEQAIHRAGWNLVSCYSGGIAIDGHKAHDARPEDMICADRTYH
jgi:hypothetical protein